MQRFSPYSSGLAASLAWPCLAGLSQAIAIATPWDGQPVWWLQLVAMTGLVWLLHRASSARQAALMGWVFATTWLCGTVWWLYISLHVYGGLAAPLAALAVLALCGFLALYYAAVCCFYRWFSQSARIGRIWNAIVFAALWLLAELCRDTLFTGFPWGAVGYAHVDGPLAGWVAWVGVYGIGCFAALLAHLAAHSRLSNAHPGYFRPFAFWLCFVLMLVSGHWLITKDTAQQSTAASAIALLQGNIRQGEKFDPTTGIKESLDWYRQQILRSTATLIVTPETAIPLLPQQLPQGYESELRSRIAQSLGVATGAQAALIGIPLGDLRSGYTNAVIGLAPSTALDASKTYAYTKHHLVPFGEFIPPLFKWFTQMMHIPLGDFARGAVGQPSFEWAGQRWAPNICYEDLFGDELAQRFVDEKSAPTIMVNVSNIGWFGNTVAIDQHLHISRMRALELGRPMVRATNTGATAIIDHRGQVTHSLPRHTQGVLIGQVQGRVGLTPYAWWAGRWGLWPLWLFSFTIIFIAIYISRVRAKR